MEPVTVFRTFNPAEAELIASRLNAAGLHPEVINQAAAFSVDGYAMSIGGIRVQVPGSEAEEAQALIAAKDPE